ncbi:hypothetical protein BO70DRAFT_294034 [Aspergillus heteromorphus CBS 117.55]|uniref:MARVEL domain-containing protein n=1 Tax=Aspergillus heteromorphus CBS 117.55 TaxID=1448321 RepID=A0A317VV76_9EURO|nr:uncharacterized protein BO70DRAFT_294034 [Aspergillus heteromorphus CBS 117.55]PWY78286.1 hypothetical protein BO70DRAFT_294034 [Aspergillus heteromorphus CBS 117.55]
MRSRASVKPSQYPPLFFHLIRATGLISTFIVGIILAVFINQLHNANYRLPWAFLVLVIAVVLALLNYLLTTLTHCFYGLSPRLSLTTNSIVLVIWLIALGLLSWSMAHTILTSCTTTYWGTSTGISVCRIYKTLFTFTIVATAAHIAAISLDVIVHRRQTRLGDYDPMASSSALNNYKMHDRNSSVMSGAAVPYAAADEANYPLYAHQHHPSDDLYGSGTGMGLPEQPHPAQRMAGGVSVASSPPSYSSDALAQYHTGEEEGYSDVVAHPQGRTPRVRFSAYGASAGYAHPGEHTGYDPAAYR